MQRMKRWLASVLSVLMLVSALPVTAIAESASWTDVVTYNLLDCPIRIGSDVQQLDNGEIDDLFDENGDYTIRLEDNALFPYEIQFTYQGRTWEEWFMSPDDRVTIGGHTFYVSSERTDPHALVQIGFHVGGDFVLAYPEKKQFSTLSADHVYSLLPLRVIDAELDLRGYFAEELKDISLSTIVSELGIMGEIGAWARWYYTDENGDYVYKNDDYVYVVGQDTTINLFNQYTSCTLELIVGNGDQLDPNNTRYRVSVYTNNMSDIFDFETYTSADPRVEIEVYDNYRFQYQFEDDKYKYIRRVEVDATTWNQDAEVYLGMKFNAQYADLFKDLTVNVYEGYYANAAEIPADAVDITAQIWNRSNMSAEGGYLKNYRYQRYYEGMPEVTVVLSRGDKIVQVEPMVLYMYAGTMSLGNLYRIYTDIEYGNGYSYRFNIGRSYTYDAGNSMTIELQEGYPADGTYYYGLTMDHPKYGSGDDCGLQYVKKAVVGDYRTEDSIPDDAEDIKAQLFSNPSQTGGGYGADYSNGVSFTIVGNDGKIYRMTVKTVEEEESQISSEPPAPTPLSSDTYFYVEGAQNAEGDRIGAYLMSYEDDSYYYNGYQTMFLLNQSYDSSTGEYVFSPVTEETIIPNFYTGYNVNVFVGHKGVSGEKQIRGETPVNFESGSPIHYSAAAEDKTHLKNYWVTFLTQQSGAKLFVNGASNSAHLDETGMPVREVFLNDQYDNHHDVFFANIGDQELTGLYVRLENAQHIKLDEYWTIRDDASARTLSPFTTVNQTKTYGELPNVGKVRLLSDGTDGVVSGTLVIGSENGAK